MEGHQKRASEIKSRACFGFTKLHPYVMGEPRFNNPKWCLFERSVSKCLVDKKHQWRQGTKFHVCFPPEINCLVIRRNIFSYATKYLNAVGNMIQLPFSWGERFRLLGGNRWETATGRLFANGVRTILTPRSLNQCHLSLLCSSKIWEHKPRPFLSHFI